MRGYPQEDILCQKKNWVLVVGNGGACTKQKRTLNLKRLCHEL